MAVGQELPTVLMQCINAAIDEKLRHKVYRLACGAAKHLTINNTVPHRAFKQEEETEARK